LVAATASTPWPLWLLCGLGDSKRHTNKETDK